MRLEARLLRAGAPGATVVHTGVGPRRARRAARELVRVEAERVAITGFGGALDHGLSPGEVVVASELRLRDGRVVARTSESVAVAGALERRGLRVHLGPVISIRSPALGRARKRVASGSPDALLVDMESAWLAAAAAGRPLAVVRAVLDAPSRFSWRGFQSACDALRSAAAALSEVRR